MNRANRINIYRDYLCFLSVSSELFKSPNPSGCLSDINCVNGADAFTDAQWAQGYWALGSFCYVTCCVGGCMSLVNSSLFPGIVDTLFGWSNADLLSALDVELLVLKWCVQVELGWNRWILGRVWTVWPQIALLCKENSEIIWMSSELTQCWGLSLQVIRVGSSCFLCWRQKQWVFQRLVSHNADCLFQSWCALMQSGVGW